jgi:SAM-dependent methyltransferase
MGSPEITSASTQFSDPRLVAIFDTINAIDGYKDFYLGLATKLSPKSIIDIGCGTGLLTCELAKRGYQMIGLEPSRPVLDLARKRDCKNVKWIEGGAQQLDDSKADLAIMTGHVAQFFIDDKSWQEALVSIHKSLSPGGHLAFESRNPLIPPFVDWPIAASHKTVTDPVAGDIEWWFKLLEHKRNKVQYELHYLFVKTGEEVISIDELIFRSQDEITQTLTDAGFSIQNIYGDWDSSPLKATSPEMIFIAAHD